MDSDLFYHLLPIIKETLPNEREEIIIEAGNSFLDILDIIKVSYFPNNKE